EKDTNFIYQPKYFFTAKECQKRFVYLRLQADKLDQTQNWSDQEVIEFYRLWTIHGNYWAKIIDHFNNKSIRDVEINHSNLINRAIKLLSNKQKSYDNIVYNEECLLKQSQLKPLLIQQQQQ